MQMQAGVCSVYLFDETDQRYVLMATEGLRKESIGKVRLAMREGLVGLVAAKEEPLNLERCRSAPQLSPTLKRQVKRRSIRFLGAPLSITARCWAFWYCSSKLSVALPRKKRPL